MSRSVSQDGESHPLPLSSSPLPSSSKKKEKKKKNTRSHDYNYDITSLKDLIKTLTDRDVDATVCSF